MTWILTDPTDRRSIISIVAASLRNKLKKNWKIKRLEMGKRIKLHERSFFRNTECPQNNVTIFHCALVIPYRMLIAEKYNSKQRWYYRNSVKLFFWEMNFKIWAMCLQTRSALLRHRHPSSNTIPSLSAFHRWAGKGDPNCSVPFHNIGPHEAYSN